MPRNAPPSYYKVNVSGPVGTRPYRQTAADEFNSLRLELGLNDSALGPVLEVDHQRIARWGRGSVDVPYWVILRLRRLVADLHRDPRGLQDRLDAAALRVVDRVMDEEATPSPASPRENPGG